MATDFDLDYALRALAKDPHRHARTPAGRLAPALHGRRPACGSKVRCDALAPEPLPLAWMPAPRPGTIGTGNMPRWVSPQPRRVRRRPMSAWRAPSRRHAGCAFSR